MREICAVVKSVVVTCKLMQALSCTKKHDHGSFEEVLDAILKGDLEDSIARIHCSPSFNMRTVIVTRHSSSYEWSWKFTV